MDNKVNGSALDLLDDEQEGFLPVVNRSLSTCVPLREIIYIERKGRVIEVVTLDQKYRYYERMEVVLTYLDGHFFQCLRGTVVNLRNVLQISEQDIEFANGMHLTLSYKPYCKIKQVYSNYIMNGRQGFVYYRAESTGG
jgi:DNA-binding LytR/AlgR family response regulator